MELHEFSALRSKALYDMKLPEIDTPMNIRLLWFDITDKETSDRRIYKVTHSHDFFEIHFVLSGCAYYTCGNEKFALKENMALFIPKSMVHHYLGCTDNIIKASVAFSISDKDDFLSSVRAKQFCFENDVAQSCDLILKLCENDDIFSPRIISDRILEIIFSACNRLEVTLPKKQKEDADSRFSMACRYIDERSSRPISCDEVAKACGFSAKQLGRIFLKNAGVPLSEYIILARVKRAKKLLTESDLTIKQAGYALGFENPASFVSFFKRHCGKSPKSYRDDHPVRLEDNNNDK